MTRDYIAHMVREIAPDCHEGEQQKLIDWIWLNLVPKEQKEEYGRSTLYSD